MIDVDICAHCFLYSRLLCYQLSSYLLFPPTRANVTVTIFYTVCDAKTVRMLDFFRQQPLPPTVRWNFRELEKTRLMQRAIGRNLACHETTADWILLIDVDYFFGGGAIDAIVGRIEELQAADSDPSTLPPLLYPRHVRVSRTHEDGDRAIERVTEPAVMWIDEADYDPSVLRAAIGGAQYLRGDVARKRGYMPNSRFQKRSKTWLRTYSDCYFRRALGTRGTAIEVPNIFRLRHGKRGRFDIGVEL